MLLSPSISFLVHQGSYILYIPYDLNNTPGTSICLIQFYKYYLNISFFLIHPIYINILKELNMYVINNHIIHVFGKGEAITGFEDHLSTNTNYWSKINTLHFKILRHIITLILKIIQHPIMLNSTYTRKISNCSRIYINKNE